MLGLTGPRLESETEQGRWAGPLADCAGEFEARIAPVDLEVFRRVSAYTAANNGSGHGALTAVANTARLEAGGTLVLGDGSKPPSAAEADPRVYKAVRAAYLRATGEVIHILEGRGVAVPPSLK